MPRDGIADMPAVGTGRRESAFIPRRYREHLARRRVLRASHSDVEGVACVGERVGERAEGQAGGLCLRTRAYAPEYTRYALIRRMWPKPEGWQTCANAIWYDHVIMLITLPGE